MERSLIVHGLLAVVAAGAAYLAWTEPKAAASDDQSVVLVPGSPERLTKIEWREDRWDVAVERQGDDVEVNVRRLKTAAQIAAEKAAAEAPAGEDAATDSETAGAKPAGKGEVKGGETQETEPNGGETDEHATEDSAKKESPAPDLDGPAVVDPAEPEKVFPGSKQARDLFEKMAPFEAARSIGKPDATKLSALGLDEPSGKLTLFFGDTQHVVRIGNSTYGSGDVYAQAEDGDIYLVPSKSLTSIRHGASTLLDRNAVGVEREDVDRLAVTAGPGGREIVQRDRSEKGKAFFADPAEPDAKLELVGNWLDRVLRLRVIDMTDERPAGMAAVEIEFFGGDGSLGVFKLWPAGEKHAVATSTRFETPFTVSKANADAIIKDVENVLQEGR
jgi:hypothetical protein